MSDEAALLKAITANADEDTPRLAYADWLDEHGDPDRAEFIRVQIALANMTPANPKWIELTERQTDLVACLASRRKDLFPENPERFYFGLYYQDETEEPFRRGFPYFTGCQMRDAEWTPKATARVAADLTRLIETTTIRGFHPYSLPAKAFADLLATPAVAALTGWIVQFVGGWMNTVPAYRLLATSPATRRVRHLALHGGVYPACAAELAKATSLDAVRRLDILLMEVSDRDTKRMIETDWFGRVEHLRCSWGIRSGSSPLAVIGKLPNLHTLNLFVDADADVVEELSKGKFPTLARLVASGPLDAFQVAILTKAKFPQLREFVAQNRKLKNDAFLTLLGSKWFGGLRSVNLRNNAIGDKGIAALVEHPVAKQMQVLHLGDNSFGKKGLMALAKPGAFPELIRLDLDSFHKRKATEDEMAAFLAKLEMPQLRCLQLQHWPVGEAGAKALAANPSLAGLTRLTLNACGIGNAGSKALFESPHLRNLVELQLNANKITTGADALGDPSVMPHLGTCWITENSVPKVSAERMKRTRKYILI